MIKISGLEHLTASKQPEVLGGLLDVSEGRPRSNQKDVLTTRSTQRCPVKYLTPAGLGYEELGGCGICASEIYFSNFLENKKEKRLK